MFIKTFSLFLLVFIIIGCFCGCEKDEEITLTIPELDGIGGYQIRMDNFFCKVITSDEYKYSRYESSDGSRLLELYITPTNMIILDNANNVNKCYYTEYEDIDQLYTNPLSRVFEDLKKMPFEFLGEETVNGNKYQVFEGYKVASSTSDKRPCKRYIVEMVFTDKETYVYDFYLFEDDTIEWGSKAPEELKKNPNWQFDEPNVRLVNKENGATVQVKVKSIESAARKHPTLPPQQSYVKNFVKVYLNKDTKKIDIIKYKNEETGKDVVLEALYTFDAKSPNTYDYVYEEMTDDELQSTMFLLSMLESLV